MLFRDYGPGDIRHVKALQGHAPRHEGDLVIPTSFVRRDGLYTSVFSAEALRALAAHAGLEFELLQGQDAYGCIHMSNAKTGQEWDRVMLSAALVKPADGKRQRRSGSGMARWLLLAAYAAWRYRNTQPWRVM